MRPFAYAAFTCLLASLASTTAMAADPWVVYEGHEGPGMGKHIVLVSGDEEYRSEEALPQLGRILATHHGFTCTVLFAINPEGGYIDPTYTSNIPGLSALDKADLLIIFTRFRNLPDEQMALIDRYLMTGKPVIGMRTATHAFKFDPNTPWAHYGHGYSGEKSAWEGGFGRLVLGEMWINHHGKHKYESTRGVIAPGAEQHPILRGIADGAIWGPTDVYEVRLPLPGDSMPLVLGEVLEHGDAFNAEDAFYGMRPETGKPVEGEKNNPMMPVAWTKSYQVPGGTPGKVFTTTTGASTDLVNPGVRRLLINAVYWSLGMEAQMPAQGAMIDLVGEYSPTRFEFRDPNFWQQAALTVEKLGKPAGE
ncbi:MAG: ThuA domain-containing protein [Candidatus Hydrogenedentes bacterium]|nr:ThuA domain-containing protein [Candidatus Hydrogenedentota bacterium]